jgi:hypothetical protein
MMVGTPGGTIIIGGTTTIIIGGTTTITITIGDTTTIIVIITTITARPSPVFRRRSDG